MKISGEWCQRCAVALMAIVAIPLVPWLAEKLSANVREWGSIADWVQAIAALLAVWVVRRVWREQATFTRDLQLDQAELTRKLHTAQLEESRNLQKDSLRPKLELSKPFKTGEQTRFSLKIRNSGLGPAILTAIRLHYQGAEIDRSHGNIGKQLLDRMATGFGVANFHKTNGVPPIGTWVTKGESIEIVAGSFTDPQTMARLSANHGGLLLSVLRDVVIEIEYASVFDETYFATT